MLEDSELKACAPSLDARPQGQVHVCNPSLCLSPRCLRIFCGTACLPGAPQRLSFGLVSITGSGVGPLAAAASELLSQRVQSTRWSSPSGPGAEGHGWESRAGH